MKKKKRSLDGSIRIAVVLSVAGVSILVLNSCSTWFQRADTFQSSFNDHSAGWLNMITIVTMLSGWLVTGAEWLRNHIDFRFKNDKGVEDKRPILPFLTIKGKSFFRRFTWKQAFNAADAIAKELLVATSKDFYLPTLIVGIGRGGAVFGSLISYELGEVPILALERQYKHFKAGRETKNAYPIRIPKAFLKHVLLVAGESHTRKTLKYFTDMLKGMGAEEIRNCVFYNQLLPEDQMASDVKIHYYGVSKKNDYIMPWQTEHSLHPSENEDDAKAQNSKIGSSVTDEENHVDSVESGFYCMRHAKTDANVDDVFIGSRTDCALNDEGKTQARNVGEYFKSIGVKFDIIYHGPMKRCIETASIISTIAGGKLSSDSRLSELDYGRWEGLTRIEIRDRYTVDYEKYCSDMSCCPTGSKESAIDVSERIAGFLQELKDSNATIGKNILVVTHKTAGRLLLQIAGHNPDGNFRDIPFDNAAIGYVSIKPDKISVILDNKQC